MSKSKWRISKVVHVLGKTLYYIDRELSAKTLYKKAGERKLIGREEFDKYGIDAIDVP